MELAKAMLPNGVSIPSRRVGDHNPKGGENNVGPVSIPSRRVGDLPHLPQSPCRPLFPSPQGGSETQSGRLGSGFLRLFPSPQGGSETNFSCRMSSHPLKFPSPQGGSETVFGALVGCREDKFPSPQGGSETKGK